MAVPSAKELTVYKKAYALAAPCVEAGKRLDSTIKHSGPFLLFENR
jgi:hypothetical protein